MTTTPVPPVDYTNLDYLSFRQAMLDNAGKPGAAGYLPQWTARTEDDFGVMLVEGFSYMGDILAYYIDRAAAENFIETAVLADSVRAKARLLDYRPDLGSPATVQVKFIYPAGTTGTIPKGTPVTGLPTDDNVTDCDPLTFETDQDVDLGGDGTATVSATEGTSVSAEVIGVSEGTVNQTFDLSESPVIESSIVITVEDTLGNPPVPWSYVDHLATARSDDLVFTTYQVGVNTTRIQFGDGVHGAVPVRDATLTADYRVGGGIVGNTLASGVQLTNSSSLPNGLLGIQTVSASGGGTDPESIDSIRQNVSKSFSTIHRGVSLEDYGNLVVGARGVAKAVALGTSYSNIRIYVLGPAYTPLTLGAKAQLSAYLLDKRMVNANVAIADGLVQQVDVTVSVHVADQYNQASVTSAVDTALTNLFSFDANDFGGRISVSDVYAACISVQGVEYASVTLLDLHGSTGLADRTMGPFQIAAKGTVVINVAGGIASSTTVVGVPVTPGAPGAPTITSVSCPSHPGTLGGFIADISWAAASSALQYAVILDFYNASAYLGSLSGGVYSAPTTTAHIVGAYASTTVDTVKIRVRAINGPNSTDGPETSHSYTCGTNPA